MTWVYDRARRRFMRDAKLISSDGYSGNGKGLNTPAMDGVARVGPLPAGWYTIGPAYQHKHLGSLVMNLEPHPNNDMKGRSLFRIHGDNGKGNFSASEGCIVQGHDVRSIVSLSSDRRLQVI